MEQLDLMMARVLASIPTQIRPPAPAPRPPAPRPVMTIPPPRSSRSGGMGDTMNPLNPMNQHNPASPYYHTNRPSGGGEGGDLNVPSWLGWTVLAILIAIALVVMGLVVAGMRQDRRR